MNKEDKILEILKEINDKLSNLSLNKKVQICPKCNGQGIVSKPPWVAGDVDTWNSTATTHVCDLCNGAKII